MTSRKDKDNQSSISVAFLALCVVLAGVIWLFHALPAEAKMHEHLERERVLQENRDGEESLNQQLRVFQASVSDDPQAITRIQLNRGHGLRGFKRIDAPESR